MKKYYMFLFTLSIFFLFILVTYSQCYYPYNLFSKLDDKSTIKIDAWNGNGNGICREINNQEKPQICSDGAGGAIITWVDNRTGSPFWSGYDIYAQKIDTDGDDQWMEDGIIICNESQEQNLPDVCSDGNGGAIIVWDDFRDFSRDIYAQRVNKSGHLLWNESGVPICNLGGDQRSPKIINDEAEGAIIVWSDSSGANYKIYAQRINSAGVINWTLNGIGISGGDGDQSSYEMCNDGANGVIIAWVDERNSNYDIYVQRIDSNGVLTWGSNGTAICTASGSQYDFQICSDGNGGAIITWEDWRIGTANIYAQRIDFNGVVQWIPNGIGICTAISHQLEPKLCSDGNGGAIITWHDGRDIGTTAYDIYAQKVDRNGNKKWNNNGIALCKAIYDQEYPEICSDGTGGAIIVWQDERNGIGQIDIYKQVISSDGDKLCNGNGEIVCNEIGTQDNIQICKAGYKYAIVAWQDARSDIDIYAQRIGVPTLFPYLDLIILSALLSESYDVFYQNRFLILLIAIIVGTIILIITLKKINITEDVEDDFEYGLEDSIEEFD